MELQTRKYFYEIRNGNITKVSITIYEICGRRLQCVSKWESRVNRNITSTDTLINYTTTKLLPHSIGSICDLKEPGGGNIPLIWCLVLIGTLSSNMSWQTWQDKHSLSPAMKYTLSNKPVPFWIRCVGETKAQNKHHSDMALKVITASDRAERAGFGLGAKTQPVIDMIPWP